MTRDAQKAATREKILESAAQLLRTRGITASSVADVMKGAGLTVGGFYAHFATKDALFATAIEHTARTKWDALLAVAKTPLDVVKRYVSRAHRDHPAEGCLLPEAIPEATREAGYREPLAREVSRFATSLAKLDSTREMALGTIALMYGALALSRGLAGTALGDEILVAARRFAERAMAT